MMTHQTLINQSRNLVWHPSPRFVLETWLANCMLHKIHLFLAQSRLMVAGKVAYFAGAASSIIKTIFMIEQWFAHI
jgi:hypothetical protein